MNKIIATLVILSGFVVNSAATATITQYDNDIKIKINGQLLYFPDQGPVLDTRANRSLVPVRFVSEALKATVNWDNTTQKVSVNRSGTNIYLWVGKMGTKVGGKDVTLDAPAILLRDRTMVPLRFVSEALGAQVQWDGATKTVLISDNYTADSTSKPPEVKTMENISGLTMQQIIDMYMADKQGEYGVAYQNGVYLVDAYTMDLSIIQKTLNSLYPGNSQIPQVMAKAKQIAEDRQANGFNINNNSVIYNIGNDRIALYSTTGSMCTLNIKIGGR